MRFVSILIQSYVCMYVCFSINRTKTTNHPCRCVAETEILPGYAVRQQFDAHEFLLLVVTKIGPMTQ